MHLNFRFCFSPRKAFRVWTILLWTILLTLCLILDGFEDDNSSSDAGETEVTSPTPDVIREEYGIDNMLDLKYLSMLEEDETLYDRRLTWLREMCRRKGHLIPPEKFFTNRDLIKTIMRDAVRNMYVDEKRGMILCQIPQVGSVNWKGLFLNATGPMKTTDPDTITRTMLFGGPKFWRKLKWLYKYPRAKVIDMLRSYFKFVFVRNPFENIVSTYREKFENVRLPSIDGIRIASQFRPNDTKESMDKGSGITFKEFVKYILTGAGETYWQSFQSLCQPCVVPYNFLGKIETFNEDSSYIANLANTELTFNDTDTGNESMSVAQTLMTYYASVPITDVRALHNMFADDLHVFNYTYPEPLKQLFAGIL